MFWMREATRPCKMATNKPSKRKPKTPRYIHVGTVALQAGDAGCVCQAYRQVQGPQHWRVKFVATFNTVKFELQVSFSAPMQYPTVVDVATARAAEYIREIQSDHPEIDGFDSVYFLLYYRGV